MCCGLFYNVLVTETIQGAEGGMTNVLGSDISHCERKSSSEQVSDSKWLLR